MSGLSTRWTASAWQTRPWETEQDVPFIVVVNRGAKAHITLTWLRSDGSIVQTDVFDLEPEQSTGRVLFYDSAPDANGWAHIDSNQPVAPWGITPHHLYLREWANMEFYGENQIPLPQVEVELAALRRTTKRSAEGLDERQA